VPDNVELIGRATAALNAGDLGEWMEAMAPDAELVDLANAPDQPEAIKGKDAIRETWTLWAEAFDDLRIETEESIPVGDFVICANRWVGEGKGSGISIDVRQFDLYEFRNGLCIAATLGLKSREEALEAAGAKAADG
jgi:ketosteroid isomerase-like protein